MDGPDTLSLLSIPRELRDRIYEILLVSDRCISVANFVDNQDLPSQGLGLWPAVLGTCRQIHDEAAGFLYRSNTFYTTINMHLHHALRRIEVSRALGHIPLAPEDDPPEPEVQCSAVRPSYGHPGRSRIRRLVVELSQHVPKSPHWNEGEVRVDHAMNDLCNAFEGVSNLSCLTIRSHGCAPHEAWIDAAGGDWHFARQLDTLMWQYHEWHFERALLAANRCAETMWLQSVGAQDRVMLDGPPMFWHTLRAASARESLQGNLQVTRHPPTQVSRSRQAARLLSDDSLRC